MRTRTMWRAVTWAMFVLAGAGACQDDAGPSSQPPDSGRPPVTPSVTLDVLFIGNSLTYFNDLPGTLAGIARAGGDIIRVEMVAGPKLSLMDQLLPGGAAEAAIRRGGWEFVVLQQGASTDSASRDTLILATEKFDKIVRSVGARPALYMVWPPATEPGAFDAARESYQSAAAAVDGVFLPVGVAWHRAQQLDPTLALYAPDGVHPSPLGTYLAAITIYEKLTGHDARGLPPRAVVNGASLDNPEQTIRLLQQAAHQADAEY